jgi:hypothetical protein
MCESRDPSNLRKIFANFRMIPRILRLLRNTPLDLEAPTLHEDLVREAADLLDLEMILRSQAVLTQVLCQRSIQAAMISRHHRPFGIVTLIPLTTLRCLALQDHKGHPNLNTSILKLVVVGVMVV